MTMLGGTNIGIITFVLWLYYFGLCVDMAIWGLGSGVIENTLVHIRLYHTFTDARRIG